MERNAGPAGSARFRRRGIVSWFLRGAAGTLFRHWEGCIVGPPAPGPFGDSNRNTRPCCSSATDAGAWVLRRCAPGPGFTLCKRGKMRFFSKSISAVPGVGNAPVRCQECAPHFLLSWQKKTCRARYKRKPPFIDLLVRPAKMGLVSSSCAKRRALPVRSRRICFIGCKLEDAKRTRGPSCAAAARPGICSKFFPRRCIYALLLPAERQWRCCAKQSYLHQQVI